jgi:serine protease
MAQARRTAKSASSMSDAWRGQDIIIKFSEQISASERRQLDAAAWIAKSGLGNVDRLKLTGAETLHPLFDAQLLANVIGPAAERDVSYRPRRLENYFMLSLGSGRCLAEVLEQVRCWHEIEAVYPSLRLGPPPGPLTQAYLNCAPRGIAYFTSSGPRLNVPGVNGNGIQFGDLEEGWDRTHPDMPPPVDPAIFPDTGVDKNINPDHGRRCVGLVTAVQASPIYYRSVAPQATTRYYSAWVKSPFIPRLNIAQAILLAIGSARRLNYGDVLLIEMQASKEIAPGVTVNLPVEITADVYDMIRLASAYGVIVVEPAGTNTGGSAQNIDPLLYGLDSGAFIVGAADEANGTLPQSNYGSRVNFFAQGDCPLSVLGPSGTYEQVPGPGTSWSAAIVAGVVVSTQGMVKAASADPAYRLGPTPMRNLLATSSATPGATPSLPIGVMPNLEAIATRFATTPDVYVRDDYSDNGSPRPTTGTLSPDITIRQTAMTPAQRADTLHNYSEDVLPGVPPILYARFYNHVPLGLGSGDLHNISVTFYYAPSSPLPTPASWTNLCTTGLCSYLSPGCWDILSITSPVAIPTSGVIVAVATALEDPAPVITGLSIGDWARVIRDNNNFAMRTFPLATGAAATTPSVPMMRSVTAKSKRTKAATSTTVPLYVEIGGADRGNNVMDVEIREVLPPGSEVKLEAPACVMQQLLRGKPPYVSVQANKVDKPDKLASDYPTDPWLEARRGQKEIWTIPLFVQVPNLFKDVSLPEKYRGGMRIHVTIPSDAKPSQGSVTVRQLLNGTEIGKITLNLARSDANPRDEGPVGEVTGASEAIPTTPGARGRRRLPRRARKQG